MFQVGVISVSYFQAGNVREIMLDQLRNQVYNALNFLACRQNSIVAQNVKFHAGLWEQLFADIEVELFGLEDLKVLYQPADPNDNAEVNC